MTLPLTDRSRRAHLCAALLVLLQCSCTSLQTEPQNRDLSRIDAREGAQTPKDRFIADRSDGQETPEEDPAADASPYLTGELRSHGLSVSSSVYWLREDGDGQLTEAFGALPAASAVASTMDASVTKVSATYSLDLWGVDFAPGVMVDVCGLDFAPAEMGMSANDDRADVLFMAMPCVRAAADIGAVTARSEVGYRDRLIGRRAALDVEAAIEWRPSPSWHAFAGYRYVDIDASDDLSDSYDAGIAIEGWVIGGGLDF